MDCECGETRSRPRQLWPADGADTDHAKCSNSQIKSRNKLTIVNKPN